MTEFTRKQAQDRAWGARDFLRVRSQEKESEEAGWGRGRKRRENVLSAGVEPQPDPRGARQCALHPGVGPTVRQGGRSFVLLCQFTQSSHDVANVPPAGSQVM